MKAATLVPPSKGVIFVPRYGWFEAPVVKSPPFCAAQRTFNVLYEAFRLTHLLGVSRSIDR
jgi:hypothetical protein